MDPSLCDTLLQNKIEQVIRNCILGDLQKTLVEQWVNETTPHLQPLRFLIYWHVFNWLKSNEAYVVQLIVNGVPNGLGNGMLPVHCQTIIQTIVNLLSVRQLGPLLLTWLNFDLSMNK